MNRLLGVYRMVVRLAALSLLPLALVMALSPRYDWAARATAAVMAVVYRPVRFPAFARDRDRSCTLAEAWSEVAPKGNGNENLNRIARGIRRVSLDGGLEQVETTLGRFWIPVTDRFALAGVVAEQEEDEYGAAASVQPGNVVLDCGANAGVFTRIALARGASRVVAIEPAPWGVECLRRTFAEEIKAGRVVVYPKGVWDRNDRLELTIAPGMATTAASVALGARGATSVWVPLTTIDAMATELRLERVDFIKMDIEGAEPNALRGALHTVEQFHPRMAISLEHRHSDPETIPALARQLWPDYQVESGSCSNMKGHLQPVVMYARPANRTASR
jgi:FkbM family methyltransferase